MDKTFLESLERNIKSKFAYLPCHHKLIKSSDNIVFIDSGLNSSMFNIIYCDGEITSISITKTIEYFRSKKLPFAFWIGFENEPAWLEDELQSLGLTTDEKESLMICSLLHLQPREPQSLVTIKQILDKAGIDDFILVLKAILPADEHAAIKTFYEQFSDAILTSNSDLKYFIAYINDKPVATSSLFCDNKVSSIFDVIVLPELRGKGLGKLMTEQAMLYAKEKGFEYTILTATNDAKYMYQKLGFRHLKTLKVYQ